MDIIELQKYIDRHTETIRAIEEQRSELSDEIVEHMTLINNSCRSFIFDNKILDEFEWKLYPVDSIDEIRLDCSDSQKFIKLYGDVFRQGYSSWCIYLDDTKNIELEIREHGVDIAIFNAFGEKSRLNYLLDELHVHVDALPVKKSILRSQEKIVEMERILHKFCNEG